MTHVVTDYAEEVVNGDIVTGKFVKWACQRHLDDLKRDNVYFDEKAATRIINFYKLTPHVKGELAGQPIILEGWQKFIVGSLFGWKNKDDDTRRFREAYIQVARKNGKALDINTPIPTPDGFKKMKGIEVGDKVFDEKGNICEVTFATDIKRNQECYEIEFDDGNKIVADKNHLWFTKAKVNNPDNKLDLQVSNNHPRARKERVRTTEEIYITQVYGKRGDNNHTIDVSRPIKSQKKDLLINPYVLGVWLGDGSSATAEITFNKKDEQIIDEIEKSGINVKVHRRNKRADQARIGSLDLSEYCRRGHKMTEENTNSRGRCKKCRSMVRNRGEDEPIPEYTRFSLQEKLRKKNLLNNKHIPQEYLFASIEQRLELLRGLLDTDGYISKAGQCEFTTTNNKIKDGILKLIASLGFKVTCNKKRATLNGKDCGVKYRIQFWAYKNTPVFKLDRKLKRQKEKPKNKTRTSRRTIVNVKKVKSRPVKCIKVNSESKLYLAGKGFIPTHNTTLMAPIGLYGLCFDNEAGAEIFSAATTRDQAKEIFDPAKQMVLKSDYIEGVEDYKNNLSHVESFSKFEPLSADYDTLDGKNIHFGLVDELHAHPDSGIWDVLDDGTGARKQPLMIAITTAGFNQESFCYKYRSYCVDMLDPRKEDFVDDSQFAYIAELDEEDDWQDEDNWVKANPNLDISVSKDNIRRRINKAKRMPAQRNRIICKRLNIWTNAESRWMNMRHWDESAGYDIEEIERIKKELEGEYCYAGLDLSSKIDITAYVKVFPREDNVIVIPEFFVPKDRIQERTREDGVPYDAWARQGYINDTEGNVVHYGAIENMILDDYKKYNIREVAHDRWGAIQLAQNLDDAGVDMIPMGQGYKSMSEPMKEVEAYILSKKLNHFGHPVLRWMADNTVAKTDPSENIKPDKDKSQERIDGIVALIMALDRLIRNEGDNGTPYDDRGIFFL
ncbi:terminase large subunit [Natroniella acetigena]|uniref:terminase TerL endonuclease subunit n=1 Tax=Natroniella acetigena TaxID=52004 RepID=UPI00200B150C|nr:terminase TerL endonuclease subunit [Natroniella acetigena]MCK8826397.1 terminase large subunit [Natroniella acetigena]